MESVAVVIAMEDMSAVRKKRISLSLSLSFFFFWLSFRSRDWSVYFKREERERVSVSVMCREEIGKFCCGRMKNEKNSLQKDSLNRKN